MSKIITIKIQKAGSTLSDFTIKDNLGNTLSSDVTKETLISGLSLSVDDNVSVIIITYSGKNCCDKSINIPITQLTQPEIADIQFETKNTGSLWQHLTDPTIYNSYYGCTNPYIIEYPFSYSFNDEIAQSVKDYTKVYKYLPTEDGVFNSNRKVAVDNQYFSEAVLYNDQQSSGILELVSKPKNNLSLYNTYPKYNSESKTITYTKSDNFYQFNTFWDISKDKQIPLFTKSCESLSIDKEVNQDNMVYSNRSFQKYKIRAKDLKIRLVANNSDYHYISQLFSQESQISFK